MIDISLQGEKVRISDGRIGVLHCFTDYCAIVLFDGEEDSVEFDREHVEVIDKSKRSIFEDERFMAVRSEKIKLLQEMERRLNEKMREELRQGVDRWSDEYELMFKKFSNAQDYAMQVYGITYEDIFIFRGGVFNDVK